jgi:hypothetical protein
VTMVRHVRAQVVYEGATVVAGLACGSACAAELSAARTTKSITLWRRGWRGECTQARSLRMSCSGLSTGRRGAVGVLVTYVHMGGKSIFIWVQLAGDRRLPDTQESRELRYTTYGCCCKTGWSRILLKTWLAWMRNIAGASSILFYFGHDFEVQGNKI